MLESSLYAVGQIDQKLAGVGWLICAQECADPPLDAAIRIVRLTLDETGQIGHFLGAVHERAQTREFFDLKIVKVTRRMFQANHTLEAQLSRAPGEVRHVHMIAEHILCSPDTFWSRANHELCSDPGLIVAVEGPQSHPVIPESDRAAVFVGRDMPYEQREHRDPLINIRNMLPTIQRLRR
jgi:hypothetical protein